MKIGKEAVIGDLPDIKDFLCIMMKKEIFMNYEDMIEFLTILKARRFLEVSPYENALISQAEIEIAAKLSGETKESLSFGVSALLPYAVANLSQTLATPI